MIIAIGSATARGWARTGRVCAAAAVAATLAACETIAPMAAADLRDGPGGEAGPLYLRDQGFFWVGKRASTIGEGERAATTIQGQMFVGYQLPVDKRHPYPLVLVHGGGGQATDWMGAPDGRDGWLDYFVAAGFDVYYVDRPGHGRSPNNRAYGELGDAPTTERISRAFTARSEQYPGTGLPDDPFVIEHVASSEPGPTVSNAVLKENFAELLDTIGPAILVTHSAGGPSGWLALDARPDMVKGVLAIETATDFGGDLGRLLTWDPPLSPGETITLEERPSEGEGLAPCMLQPEGAVRMLPAYEGKPIMGVVAPNSSFAPRFHCAIALLDQVGADAELTRLEDLGIEGNGHFMNEELNNGEIAAVLIEWLASVE